MPRPLTPEQRAGLEKGRRIHVDLAGPTPEQEAGLISDFLRGLLLTEAAAARGVKYASVCYWLSRGRQGSPRHAALLEAYEVGADARRRRRDARAAERMRRFWAAVRRTMPGSR